MTARISRVRVAADPWAGGPARWLASCPWCPGQIAEHRHCWEMAVEDALDHQCAGVRLTALITRLEAMRDERSRIQPQDLATWGIKSEDHCEGWAAAQRQSGYALTKLLEEFDHA